MTASKTKSHKSVKDNGPDDCVLSTSQKPDTKPENVFSKSVMISGFRCILAYVILPFVLPWFGMAPGVGPALGLVIGPIAIVANIFSIRRFWRADHRWKVPITVINLAIIILLMILLVDDIKAIL